jgi:hypothetical protein
VSGPNDWDMAFRLGRSRVARHLLTRSLRSNLLDGTRDAVASALPGWGDRLREIAARNAALVATVLELTGKEVFAAEAES